MTNSTKIENWLTRMFCGKPRPYSVRRVTMQHAMGTLVVSIGSKDRRWVWQPSAQGIAEKFDKIAQRDCYMLRRGQAYVITVQNRHGTRLGSLTCWYCREIEEMVQS